MNKLRLRMSTVDRGSDLLGYKIHCVGRFSRSDRASSILFVSVKFHLVL